MSPVSSAIGMKADGGMKPLIRWFHRASASKPITLLSRRLTIGW